MKSYIIIIIIFMFVGCTTTTTNIQHVEHYNDNKVNSTSNTLVGIDDPGVDNVIANDNPDIDYYHLFYTLGVVGLSIFGGGG